jgi:hypothetical protein
VLDDRTSSSMSSQDRVSTVLAAHLPQHPVNISSSDKTQFLLTPEYLLRCGGQQRHGAARWDHSRSDNMIPTARDEGLDDRDRIIDTTLIANHNQGELH